MKKLFFTLGITILILAGCQSVMNNQTSPPNVEVTSGSEVTIANSQTKPSSDSTNSIETNSSTSANNGDSSISGNNSATNDNTVGLKNVKVDSNNNELTPSQKSVIEYFDNDYFYISNDKGYEFLQRYPLVFKDSQINIIGKVEKIISDSNDKYQILVNLIDTEEMFYAWHWDMDYESYLKEREKNLIVLTGHSEETRIIEGDFIHSFGRYKDIESYMIDSKSYSLPVLASQRTDIIPSDVRYIPDKFDDKFIKAVAKIIFGEDIEVREPILGEDIPEWPGTMFNLTSFLTVELENQGNAKFTKYFMGKNYGWILDAKTGPYSVTQNMDIERFFEFTKDLKNYFVMTHDLVQETFKIDFYDINLNKIWSREFEGTENAVYDYTEYNLYLIANNDLYTINLDNGEDTYQSQYIGDKLEIRKLENGILTISKDNSDGIMMLNLDGSILWKRNLEYDVSMVEEVQLNGENIVVSLSLQEDEDAITEQHYLVIDKISGEIKLDAVTKSRIQ